MTTDDGPISTFVPVHRRRWVLAPVVVGLLLLSGCSGSGAAGGTDLSAAEDTVAAEAGGAAPGDAGAGEELAPGSASSTERMVVKDGELLLRTEDPVAAAAQVATTVERLGGRVDSREIQAGFEGAPGSASLTVRVPAESLDEAVADLGTLGEVERYRESTRDVTDAVVDLDARIEAGEASVARVEEFLARAQDATELLATERELSQRQADLESLKAQRAALAGQVAMSTLSVSLAAPGGAVVERPGPRTFGDGLSAGWRALWSALRGLTVVVGVLLPWLALAAIVTVAVTIPLRMTRARRTPPTPPAPPAPPPPQQPVPPAAPAGDPTPVGAPPQP